LAGIKVKLGFWEKLSLSNFTNYINNSSADFSHAGIYFEEPPLCWRSAWAPWY